MRAASHIESPPADLSFLIAETGQPDFPGWELIAAALMVATLLALIAPDAATLLRRRSERARNPAPIERVIKPTNAVRQVARRAVA